MMKRTIRRTFSLLALVLALALTLSSCGGCVSCSNIKPVVEEEEVINELGFQLCISNLPDATPDEESCGEVKVEFVLILN
jgi:hypothetical protein